MEQLVRRTLQVEAMTMLICVSPMEDSMKKYIFWFATPNNGIIGPYF